MAGQMRAAVAGCWQVRCVLLWQGVAQGEPSIGACAALLQRSLIAAWCCLAQVLPFFHIYHGAEGRVAAFSCTVSKFQRMRDALENYYTPICSLEDNPGLPEFPDIVPHPNEITRLTSVAGVHLPIGPVGAASAAAAAAEQLMASQAAPAAVA